MASRFRARTVTFDCWQTLIYDDQPPGRPQHGRLDMLQAITGRPREQVARALSEAWAEHQRAWHRRLVFAGPQITRHALDALDTQLASDAFDDLVRRLEDEISGHRICAVEGARELLQSLRDDGVRVALVCDTGFSPGRVVRELLDRVGLLSFLEVQIFSDEVGVPKPHARAFQAALDGLGVAAHGAVHVGDLRRSDIAGARAVGMTTARFAGRNDDTDSQHGAQGAGIISCADAGCVPECERPEADVVIARYPALADWLRS